MHLDPAMPILAGTALVIFLLGLTLRRLRQPHVVVYLAAGLVLGRHGLALIEDEHTLSRLGAIGVDLLLFFAGMEVSPRRLFSSWRLLVLGTLLQTLISVGCVFALGLALGWPVARCVLLGFVISLSSTAVVIKMLEQWGETDSAVGQGVIGVLLAQDVALIPMLIVIGLFQGERLDPFTLARQLLGGVLILFLLAWLSSRPTVRLPFGRTMRSDHELQVFGALLICLGLALVTGLLGLSTALGAFVAGIVVGLARETEWVHRSLEPFRVVFVALFFVSVGMLVDLDFVGRQWHQIAALLVVVLVVNTAINAGMFRLFGFGGRDSLYGGAMLSQIGEFSFVLAAVGLQAGIVGDFAHDATVAIIAASLVLSPAWIGFVRLAQKRHMRPRSATSGRSGGRG